VPLILPDSRPAAGRQPDMELPFATDTSDQNLLVPECLPDILGHISPRLAVSDRRVGVSRHKEEEEAGARCDNPVAPSKTEGASDHRDRGQIA
jgi:hypothetical protein